MSDVHNALTRGALSAAIKRALGDTKGEAGLERYGETLQPTIDLWSLPEWAYLRGERIVAESLLVAALAVNRSRVGLENPVGSGYLVVVDHLMNIDASLAVLATLGTGLTIDTRAPTRPLDTRYHTATSARGITNLTSRQGAIGGATTTVGYLYLIQGVDYKTCFVLRPGWFLSIDPNLDNTAIQLAFRARERRLLPTEDGER